VIKLIKFTNFKNIIINNECQKPLKNRIVSKCADFNFHHCWWPKLINERIRKIKPGDCCLRKSGGTKSVRESYSGSVGFLFCASLGFFKNSKSRWGKWSSPSLFSSSCEALVDLGVFKTLEDDLICCCWSEIISSPSLLEKL